MTNKDMEEWRPISERDASGVDDRLFDAARRGDVTELAGLLDRYPEKRDARDRPYGQTLLHLAAKGGHLPAVELLLARGLDVNARDSGDNSYPMHWAAAAGHLDVVRRLADAGGDVVGAGDDHQLEVIGWASCWDGADDEVHRAIAAFLVSRGARHHIFSAIAFNLGDELRRIVALDPAALGRPQSRNEDFQLPLHFAVRQQRPEMVALLLELGADPLGKDGSGFPAAAYATAPDTDRPVFEVLRARGGPLDLLGALALGDEATAARLLEDDPGIVQPGGASFGVQHLMAKRGDAAAVAWLLGHGVDPSAVWPHWGCRLTPLHLAALGGHTGVARLLLAGGADPAIKDSEFDSDALGWAEFFKRTEIVELLARRA